MKDSGVPVLARGQLLKLKEFVKFVMYVYVPWLIAALVASGAPSNDLHLINRVMQYRKTNAAIAGAALNAIGRHTWYLTEELVPLSFFCYSVSNDQKQKMAQKLRKFEVKEACINRCGTGYGKPVLPRVPIAEENDLRSFIGQDSYMFFKMLKLDSQFLSLPVKQWETDVGYQLGKHVISNLCVVNDAAERGVKLCYDFLHSAKKEENLEHLASY